MMGFVTEDSRETFIPRKRWGQHFLIDPNITRKIIDGCQLKPQDVVLEIGPGQGVLTQEIAGRVQRLFAIERDPRLCTGLRERFLRSSEGPEGAPTFRRGARISIIESDFLKYDLKNLPQPLKVIGNLPYYISSPILVRLLEHHQQFTDLFFTLQWELGRRLVAKASTKDYSALSCLVQFYTQPQLLFKIKNTCFRPIPKVDSCFVHLSILPQDPFVVQNKKLFFDMIRTAFQQRRKTIVNSLSGLVAKDRLQGILDFLSISSRLRAEDLTLKNYVDISNALRGQGG